MKMTKKKYVFIVSCCIIAFIIYNSLFSTNYYSSYYSSNNFYYTPLSSSTTSTRTTSTSSFFTPTYNNNVRISSRSNTNANLTINQSRPFPHANARDANGLWGYVHDVTLVRNIVLDKYYKNFTTNSTKDNTTKNSLLQWRPSSPYHYQPYRTMDEINVVCNTPVGQYDIKIGEHSKKKLDDNGKLKFSHEETLGYELLRHAVQNYENPHDRTDYDITRNNTIPPSSGKVLCAVYTHEGKHGYVHEQMNTWGWKCDGFFASSTKTVWNYTNAQDDWCYGGCIDLPHYGDESYNNMWQKTRSIVGYMYDNYLDDYDYFFICGDDTFLIYENLMGYLGLVEYEQNLGTIGKAVHLGHHVKFNRRQGDFVGGGPGYVLNKEALYIIGSGKTSNGTVATSNIGGGTMLDTCRNEEIASAEDRYISNCIASTKLIHRVDTADVEHRQRFLGVPPNLVASLNPYQEKHWSKTLYELWSIQDGHGRRWGTNLTSSQSVSFHKIIARHTTTVMKRAHSILYNSCPPGTVLYDTMNTNNNNTNSTQNSTSSGNNATATNR